MSLSLARRYRPKTLKDLLGQDILRNTLINAFDQHKVPQGIVLHGIRGIGKTTTARIIARALNCTSQDVKPCLTCTSCMAMDEGKHLDVIEIDAASHTSVDSMRNIIDSVRYKAVQGFYKVFIIDEAHMLSKSAFNALLKTLEEPPSHVVFILATTDMHKIPATILSRCQKFELKPFDVKSIVDHLVYVLKHEHISFDPLGVQTIARMAKGSMRDALSLCDQAIALGSFDEKTIKDMVGAQDVLKILNLIRAMLSGQVSEVITLTHHMSEEGSDPCQVIQDVMDVFYWMILYKHDASQASDLLLSQEEQVVAKVMGDELTLTIFLQLWPMLLKEYQNLKISPQPWESLTVLCLRICYLKNLIQGTPVDEHEVFHFSSFDQLIVFLDKHKEAVLKNHLLRDAVVTKISDGHIELYPSANLPTSFKDKLVSTLSSLTHMNWIVEMKNETADILNHPVVAILKDAFPNGIVWQHPES
jgi:DNA polymerase-3 subunit gamma/tau